MRPQVAKPRIQYGIVVSRFNEIITQRLLDGCCDELSRIGVPSPAIQTVWVPGAYEIPVMALTLAKLRTVKAVICLGAVVKGETLHFDLVAQSVGRGIMEVALKTGKPIIFGVLAVETLNQAYARSEPDGDNRGRDAARSAIDMVNALKNIS